MINVNVSQPNDGLGDKLRDAFIIVNDNFNELFSLIDGSVDQSELDSAIDSINSQINNIVTNLDNDLTNILNILNTKSDIGHTHLISEISGLQTILNSLVTSTTFNAQITSINSQIASINDILISLQETDNNFQIDIAELQDNVITLQGNVTDLQNTDITLQNEIDDLQDQINNIPPNDLQSVTDAGNTTTTQIIANGGVEGSTDYASFQLLSPYYNDMKWFRFSTYGDGTDFSVNSGCQFVMNPEEGIYIQRFDYDNSRASTIGLASGSLNFSNSYGTYSSYMQLDEAANINLSSNGFAARLRTDLLTDNRTFQFPDEDGTLALLSDVSSSITNANNTLLNTIVKQTVTNGVTSSCPSQDAVYDFVTAAIASATASVTTPSLSQVTAVGNTCSQILVGNGLDINGGSGYIEFDFTGSNVNVYDYIDNEELYTNITKNGDFFKNSSTAHDLTRWVATVQEGIGKASTIEIQHPLIELESYGEVKVTSPTFSIQGGVYKGTFKTTNLTTDRIYQLPNNSGTIALLSDISTATASMNLQQVTNIGATTSKAIELQGGVYTNNGNLSSGHFNILKDGINGRFLELDALFKGDESENYSIIKTSYNHNEWFRYDDYSQNSGNGIILYDGATTNLNSFDNTSSSDLDVKANTIKLYSSETYSNSQLLVKSNGVIEIDTNSDVNSSMITVGTGSIILQHLDNIFTGGFPPMPPVLVGATIKLEGFNGVGVQTNSYTAYLKADNLFSDRSYQFPNASGTFSLVGHTHSINDVTGLTSSLALKANDNAVVKLTGDQSISGVKSFSQGVINLYEGANGVDITLGTNEDAYSFLHDGNPMHYHNFNDEIISYYGKDGGQANITYGSISGIKNYSLPNASGTFSLTSDLANYVSISGGTAGNPQLITGFKRFTNAVKFDNVIELEDITAGGYGSFELDEDSLSFYSSPDSPYTGSLYRVFSAGNAFIAIGKSPTVGHYLMSNANGSYKSQNLIDASGKILIKRTSAPATPTSAGVEGETYFDGTNFYWCYSDNNWRRVAGSTW
ncbi:hypothetical protein ABGT15_04220 [Flavobacterium enshiense]|uniref:hypothetical protein n=1 Tax=Flavobacterium enshiense TaxID=1341165 RepID=UPI00345D43A6